MTETLAVEIATKQPELAARFFDTVVGWDLRPAVGGWVASPAKQVSPMLELAEGTGRAPGFYCLHLEVPDVRGRVPEVPWIETVPPGLEERPPGRRLHNLRWSGWGHYLALFEAREPYWTLTHARCVVIGEVRSLDDAAAELANLGWLPRHRWGRDGSRGCYLEPDREWSAEVCITAADEIGEQIGVHLKGVGAGSLPAVYIPGLHISGNEGRAVAS